MPQDLRDRLARLAELTDDELAALQADLQAWYTEARSAEDARDHVDELREAVEAAGTIRAEQATREAQAAEVEAELAALDVAMNGEEEAPAEEPAAEPEPEEEAPAEEPEPAEEEAVLVPAAAETPAPAAVPVAAAATPPAAPRRAPVSAAAGHVPAAQAPRTRPARQANRVVGVQGGVAGLELPGGISDVGQLIAGQIRATHGTAGNGVKLAVARVLADYEPDRILGMDPDANQALIEAVGAGTPEALVAAGGYCAPATPYYGMAVIEDDARPVRAGLANFQAARGAITVTLPDQIGDFDDATDEWTNADDLAVTATSSTWKPVQTITCGTPVTYQLRAVTRILQFGNLDARTYPEKVDAIVAKAMANHARLAESLLLDDIKGQSTVVNANGIVGASRDTLVRVSQAAAGYRNRNRMPVEATLDWYAPAWLRDAMQSDIALQAPGDDALGKALAEIEGYLRERNVRPLWYLDSPSTGHSQYFGAQTGGAAGSTLNGFPSYAQWALHHQGAFLFADGGELDLGVVRDSTLNRQNSHQIFAETFEKAAYVGVEALWVTQLVDVSGGYSLGDEVGS